MRKAKPKPADALSECDLLRLRLAQAHADAAAAALEAAKVRRALVRTQREVDLLQLADKYRLSDGAAQQNVVDANNAFETARATQQTVAQQVAAKYGVDWASCAYNEETGAIERLPLE